MTDNKFDGGGFEKTPIKGEEAARHRHMYHVVGRNWVMINKAELQLINDGVAILRTIKIITAFSKVAVPTGLLGLVGGAAARILGWI